MGESLFLLIYAKTKEFVSVLGVNHGLLFFMPRMNGLGNSNVHHLVNDLSRFS